MKDAVLSIALGLTRAFVLPCILHYDSDDIKTLTKQLSSLYNVVKSTSIQIIRLDLVRELDSSRHPPCSASARSLTSLCLTLGVSLLNKHCEQYFDSNLLTKQTMFFKSSRKTQAEKDRLAREETNLHRGILQLPAELRNQIYEQSIISGREIKHGHHWQYLKRLPPLLHVCRGIREEVYPLFFGTNQVTIILNHLVLHPRSVVRMRSCVLLLPDNGTTSWRKLRIECCSRCFHPDGFAVLTNMDVFIDRSEGTVMCQPRAYQSLRPCCQQAQKEYSTKLVSQIKSCGLPDEKRKLRRQDVERLARRMDENRGDWPKSAKRVVPPRTQWR